MRKPDNLVQMPKFREAGVGVRAVLLGGTAAVAVGEAVADAVEVVLDPLG